VSTAAWRAFGDRSARLRERTNTSRKDAVALRISLRATASSCEMQFLDWRS
jgi:hypothetical protein